MIPFPVVPPTIQASVPVVPLKAAVEQVMQDFDAEDPASPIRNPVVPRGDKLSLRWLRSAATLEMPQNPFHQGTASFLEGEALLALLKADRAHAEGLLPRLKVHEPGTALALWRWAKRQERASPWSPALRRVWEDKLLAQDVPAMVNGYALRHGLCWALAEKDETRFAALKAAWGQDSPALLASFQGLFGWFGGISPAMRLWTLPELQYRDLRLDLLLAFDGSKPDRIWISPDPSGIGPPMKMPARTAWIIPSLTGTQNSNEPSLIEGEKTAATALSMSVASAKGQAYFAPSRAEFEEFGLVFFPILIKLGPDGTVQDILMGDAAPRMP